MGGIINVPYGESLVLPRDDTILMTRIYGSQIGVLLTNENNRGLANFKFNSELSLDENLSSTRGIIDNFLSEVGDVEKAFLAYLDSYSPTFGIDDLVQNEFARGVLDVLSKQGLKIQTDSETQYVEDISKSYSEEEAIFPAKFIISRSKDFTIYYEKAGSTEQKPRFLNPKAEPHSY